MIEVKNLRKSFGDVEVLKGIDFTFERGKTNLIIGQSGSGKTVFIKCMVGLHRPDAGEILFDGDNMLEMSYEDRKQLRQNIGMVFQGGALFDSLTVEENVMFPMNLFSQKSLEEKLDRVNFCLKRVNLDNVNKLLPAELSGGMQKRVAIARAIVMEPKYLFCDEPNSGLDPNTAIVIDNLVQEITEEYQITTVINTHDMNSVMEIGENIIFLKDGLKAWNGTREDLFVTDNKELVDFVFSSRLFKKVREVGR
jgi:phospholipid/cholesterol/gamma-HCH transport system ATP-binding protein